MKISITHLLWANAFVAAYLSLCRTAAWALSFRDAEGIRGWVGTMVLFGTGAALCYLLESACRRIVRGRGPLMKGEYFEFKTLVAVGLIASASVLATRAWFYGIPMP
jgi:hypothetical protein